MKRYDLALMEDLERRVQFLENEVERLRTWVPNNKKHIATIFKYLKKKYPKDWPRENTKPLQKMLGPVWRIKKEDWK